MSREPRPLFLERETYRKRRMLDAARVLPVLGIVLLCLPMLWTGPEGEGAYTTGVMGYIFGIWLALVVLAAGLSAYLGARQDESDPPDPTSGQGE